MSHWLNITPTMRRSQKWHSYWNLFISLVSRDIRSRYRRTFLGPLWAIIPAILTTAIFSFLNRLVEIDSQGAPYVVFAFSTIVPWTYFQKAVVRIPHGILANATLLRKMAVPRQIFPLVVLATAFFDFLMSFAVLLVVLLLYQRPVTSVWLWLPLLTALLSLLAWVIGIGITSFTIYRRDMLYGLPSMMQVWMFLTPVAYSLQEIEGNLRFIYALNPAVGIIDGFRQALVFGRPPDMELLLIGFLVTLLGLLLAYPLFHLMSRYFADVL